jgi:hypothetical protein
MNQVSRTKRQLKTPEITNAESVQQNELLCWAGWPRVYKFTGYLLPRDTRERVFDTAFDDLYAHDYLEWLDERPRSFSAKFAKNVLFSAWASKLLVECLISLFRRCG